MKKGDYEEIIEFRTFKKKKCLPECCKCVSRFNILELYWGLFYRNPAYIFLFLATVISTLGDHMSYVAVIMSIQKNVGVDSPYTGTVVFLVYACAFVPQVLTMPLTGTVTDLFEKRFLLIVFDVIRGVLVGGFIVGFYFDCFYVYYGVYFFEFICSSFFKSAKKAIVPSVVATEDIPIASSLDSVAVISCKMLGNFVGMLLYDYFGPIINWGVDSFSYFCSAFCVLFLFCFKLEKKAKKQKEMSIQIPELKKKNSLRDSKFFKNCCRPFVFLKEVILGLKLILLKPYLFSLSTMRFLYGVKWGMFENLLVRICATVYPIGDEGVTTYGTTKVIDAISFGISPIICVFLLEKVFKLSKHKNYRFIIVISNFFRTIGYLMVGFSKSEFLYCWNVYIFFGAQLFIGMGGGLYFTYVTTLIQQYCPRKYMGRIFSIDIAGFALGALMTSGITALLLDLSIDPLFLMLCLAGVSFILFIYFSIWYFIFYSVSKDDLKKKIITL